MTTTVNIRLKMRGRLAADWTSGNEVLLAREMGLETDTRKFKFGDGTTAWNSLAYAGVTLGTGAETFLATPTSANLRAMVTDETGTGSLVFATSPNITTPTGIVKGDVGLGNVDNTSDANKPVSSAQQTALDLKANLTGAAFTGSVTVTRAPDDNNGLVKLQAATGSAASNAGLTLFPMASGANTNARSWQMVANYSGHGSWDLLRSTTSTGNPGTTTVNIDRDGNVGINKSGAGAKLEIVGSADGFPGGYTSNLKLTATNYPTIYFTRSSDGLGYLYGVDGNGLNLSSVAAGVATSRMLMKFDGKVGFACTDPQVILDVNDDSIRVRTSATPASTGTGKAGEIAWDADYLYVCTATNTWKRVALTGGY